MGVEDTVTTGFRMPKDLREEIERMAAERKIDLTVILNEACAEYVERKNNPVRPDRSRCAVGRPHHIQIFRHRIGHDLLIGAHTIKIRMITTHSNGEL